MDDSPQLPEKKELPDNVRRELRKGETIYHSLLANHVSKKFPEGKWIADVRRDEGRMPVRYPIKGFGTPRDALIYVKGLRPDARGNFTASRPNEPTVRDLYDYVTKHSHKRLSQRTTDNKEIRWRLHIEPHWADWKLTSVTRRAAQEWVTEVEEEITGGKAGELGLSQFEKVRADLHALFEAISSFSEAYEEKKNPFAGLSVKPPEPRSLVTLESQHFSNIVRACRRLVEEGQCTDWVAQMFLTSLFSGLRKSEVIALCRDQVDLKVGALIVDRALRLHARSIHPRTRLEAGPVVRQAMNYPKGGKTPTDRSRVVPLSDQLVEILRPILKQSRAAGADWDLLWPSVGGKMKEDGRFQSAWRTLRARLDELATLAPMEQEQGPWPVAEKQRGWERNRVVEELRSDPKLRLPNVFGAVDFRDTRNSFASYMNEVGISQATREEIMGHGGTGITNAVYTQVTTNTFRDARAKLTKGWKNFVESK